MIMYLKYELVLIPYDRDYVLFFRTDYLYVTITRVVIDVCFQFHLLLKLLPATPVFN